MYNFYFALRCALCKVIEHTSTREINSEIPEDIVIEILSRLPRKTLARFECVSKEWRYLIRNTIPVPDNIPKILILSRSRDGCSTFLSIDDQFRSQRLSIPIDEDLLRGRDVKALCSCAGSLLIRIDSDLFVWNPLTKFFKKVPRHQEVYNETYYNHGVLIDLCYDYTSHEYKVILVEKTCNTYPSIKDHVYVTTCGATSWEKIDVPYCFHDAYVGPFFKGYKHWICKGYWSGKHEERSGPNNHLVYFDPQTNEFIEIPKPQPKNMEANGDTFLGLGVRYGCLCMTRWDIQWNNSNYERNLEFLVMKEYGDGSSWDIMFVINNLSCYTRTMVPLFETIEGEELVCRNGWSLEVYDANGNHRSNVLFPSYLDSYHVVYYEEGWYAPTVSHPSWSTNSVENTKKM